MAEVTMSGPLFDGTAKRVMAAYCDDSERAIADRGVDLVQSVIATSAHRRTGNYEAHVQADRSRGDSVINDSNIVYGPWLEGTSRRNQSTRFKGYRQFRLSTARLQSQAVGIAETRLRPYLRRLG